MKTVIEIREKIYAYEFLLTEHEKNPEKYEPSFTQFLKDSIDVLKWVLK